MTETKEKPTGWERVHELRESREVVRHVYVFVHGTFADESDHDGNAWWQTKGVLAQELDNNGWFVIPFNWSGKNSETARRSAGKRLWVLFSQLEDIGIPYSVVGHSHGGMLIWNALSFAKLWNSSERLASPLVTLGTGPETFLPLKGLKEYKIPDRGDEKAGRLPLLKSWATIGTPFLKHKRKWTYPDTVAMLFFLCLAALSLGMFLIGFWENDLPVGYWFFAMTPFALMCLILLGYRRYRRSKHLTIDYFKKTLREFDNRHIAIWSGSDEAINALRGSLKLEVPLLPRVAGVTDFAKRERTVWERHEESDLYSDFFLWALIQWLIFVIDGFLRACAGTMLNVILAVFDFCIAVPRIKSYGLGDDVLGCACVEVSSHPGQHLPDTSLEKTHKIDFDQLVSPKSSNLSTVVRSVLFDCASSGLAAIQDRDPKEFSDLLIHNSYFTVKAVRELIIEKITSSLD